MADEVRGRSLSWKHQIAGHGSGLCKVYFCRAMGMLWNGVYLYTEVKKNLGFKLEQDFSRWDVFFSLENAQYKIMKNCKKFN